MSDRTRAVRAAGWVAVAVPGLLLLGVVAGVTDRVVLLTGVVLVLPLLHLPSWLGLGAALATRDRTLGLVAAGVLAGHLVLVWPLLPGAAGPVPPPDQPTFTVLASNALDVNPTPRAYARALLDQAADVIVVHEHSYEVGQALLAEGVAAAYPQREEAIVPGGSAIGIYSRLPIERAEPLVLGLAAMRVTVAVEGVEVELVGVHTAAPTRGIDQWDRSFAAIRELVGNTPEGPLVLAGDFNATMAHANLRDLLGDTRLRDAHLDRGRGHARTWPASYLVPLALIDRVLVSDEVGVVDIAERTVPGSDHRAVLATLSVPA